MISEIKLDIESIWDVVVVELKPCVQYVVTKVNQVIEIFPTSLFKECDLSVLKLLFNQNNHFQLISLPLIPPGLKNYIFENY